MFTFRNFCPRRQKDRTECKNYTSYLKTLRADFNNRCGYCDDLDKFRIRSFTIDHFVPQNPIGFQHTIKPNVYDNLVYCCKYCNAAKTNKWPTLNAAVHNDGSVGFIEPCSDQYCNLLARTSVGSIIPADAENALAKHIIKELKLWLPVHEKMWKLERINILNLLVKSKIASLTDETQKDLLTSLHYEILCLLDELQSSIFSENN